MVAFSFDKMFSVAKANRVGKWFKNVKFQLAIIFAIIVFNNSLYVVIPINFEPLLRVRDNVTTCTMRDRNFLLLFSSIYLYEAILLPFALMMISTIVTIVCLVKSRKRVEAMGSTALPGMAKRKARDVTFAINSIVQNSLFILMLIPFVLISLYPSQTPVFLLIFRPLSIFLFNLNFAMPFFAYLISNSIFRAQLVRFVTSLKRPNISTAISTIQPRSNAIAQVAI